MHERRGPCRRRGHKGCPGVSWHGEWNRARNWARGTNSSTNSYWSTGGAVRVLCPQDRSTFCFRGFVSRRPYTSTRSWSPTRKGVGVVQSAQVTPWTVVVEQVVDRHWEVCPGHVPPRHLDSRLYLLIRLPHVGGDLWGAPGEGSRSRDLP